MRSKMFFFPAKQSLESRQKDEKEKFSDETIKGILHNDSFEHLKRLLSVGRAHRSRLKCFDGKTLSFKWEDFCW